MWWDTPGIGEWGVRWIWLKHAQGFTKNSLLTSSAPAVFRGLLFKVHQHSPTGCFSSGCFWCPQVSKNNLLQKPPVGESWPVTWRRSALRGPSGARREDAGEGAGKGAAGEEGGLEREEVAYDWGEAMGSCSPFFFFFLCVWVV